MAVLAALSALRKDWHDGGRFLLAGLGAWLIGKAFNVAWHYARNIPRAPARALPIHIVLISISYCLLIVVGVVDTLQNIPGQVPVSWKFPARFIAYTIGIVALRMMNLHLSYERSTREEIEDRFTKCPVCGSSYASKYCSRCGALQPGKENDPE